jgi:hypothetical protein
MNEFETLEIAACRADYMLNSYESVPPKQAEIRLIIGQARSTKIAAV